MKIINVPFVENPDDRCVPATIGMVLGYFMPEKNFNMADLDELTGYQNGLATWRTQSMLSLSKMGLNTNWIEDFDYQKFINSPKEYLQTILSPEALTYQVEHGDLTLEAKRLSDYLAAGNKIVQRVGTQQDIKEFINKGWLVSLEVNANPLAGKPGYEGHSVLVIGYDESHVTIHNPDGKNGNRPRQVIPWEKLEEAWREFGGSYSIYAFKK